MSTSNGIIRDLPDRVETREVDAGLIEQLEKQDADYGVIEIARRYETRSSWLSKLRSAESRNPRSARRS